MPIEIRLTDQQLVLHEEPIEVFLGDQVEFVLADWAGGEVRMAGEVVRLFDHGRAKVRLADGSVSVPIAALQVIERRAA
jgi:hypothetical protein